MLKMFIENNEGRKTFLTKNMVKKLCKLIVRTTGFQGLISLLTELKKVHYGKYLEKR